MYVINPPAKGANRHWPGELAAVAEFAEGYGRAALRYRPAGRGMAARWEWRISAACETLESGCAPTLAQAMSAANAALEQHAPTLEAAVAELRRALG